MTTLNKSFFDAELYARVEKVPMNETERAKVLATLESADIFVNRLVWAIEAVRRAFKGYAPKPGLRNKLAA